MDSKYPRTSIILLLVAMTGLVGCSERDLDSLAPAPISTDPVVFDDTFGAGVDYQAFMGSLFRAVDIETDPAHVQSGAASLKVEVPGPNAPDGTFAGGAFVSSSYRDLSGYDALSFWAKTSVGQGSTLNIAGFGNDNTGTSLHEVQRLNVPLTTDWSLVVIPIPDPSRLTLERGLFFFAEGHENNAGFDMWFDEIRFIRTDIIINPRPAMATSTIESYVGTMITPQETSVTFTIYGEDITVGHSHRYFDYFSSDEEVVRIAGGSIMAVGAGTAVVTAKLDTVDVAGSITVDVLAPPSEPAPLPTYPASDVIALFSDVYNTVRVDSWLGQYSGPPNRPPQVEDFLIDGNAVKLYKGLANAWAIIEFKTLLVDASDMSHLRLDVWAVEGTSFRVRLVDADDPPSIVRQIEFDADTVPAFEAGQWSVLDIPLADFNMPRTSHLAEIVISSSNVSTVFVDNVLFHR